MSSSRWSTILVLGQLDGGSSGAIVALAGEGACSLISRSPMMLILIADNLPILNLEALAPR